MIWSPCHQASWARCGSFRGSKAGSEGAREREKQPQILRLLVRRGGLVAQDDNSIFLLMTILFLL